MIKHFKNILNFFERNYKALYIFSFVFLILFTLPRFNQNNFSIVKKLVGNNGHLGEYSIDTENYINIIEYMRGDDSQLSNKQISQPYTYRVLPLFISSLFTFDSFTSLNFLSLISLLIALFFQYKILDFLNISGSIRILASFMFTISFPIFYFGTSGFVDPFLIMLLYICILFILKKQDSKFLIFLFLASLSKETSILLIPFFFLHNQKNSKTILNTSIAILLYIVGTYIARNVIDLPKEFIWEFDLENLIFNLTRPRAYFSYLIAYSYFLPFIYLAYKDIKDKQNQSLIYTIVLANCVYIFAFFSAYPDSRLIWTAYPFSIILISRYFHNFVNKQKIS